jgi:hypothetical protein
VSIAYSCLWPFCTHAGCAISTLRLQITVLPERSAMRRRRKQIGRMIL